MKDDSPVSQDLDLKLNQKMFQQERYVDAAHWWVIHNIYKNEPAAPINQQNTVVR